MAVQEQTPYIVYECNGTTKAFPVGFDCEDQDTLIVLLDDVKPSLGDWYLENGSVIFRIAPKSASKLTMQRNTSLERTTNYDSYNNSLQPQAINKDFDRIWYALQEFKFTDYLHKLSINYAIDTAEEAKKVSNAATATANAAKDTADGIEGKVNTANSTASAAKNTADAAVVTANTAKTTADNATTTANGIDAKATQAQKDADTALSSVGGFDDRITNATIAANTANTNAAAANKTATEAKLSANNATEAVANKANKAETLAGYGIKDAYTKTEADTLFVEASQIGQPNGVAGLDALGKLDSSEFPLATETTFGVAKIATTAIAQAGVNDADFLTAKKLRDALNATGGAPISACRAWADISGGYIRVESNILSVVRTAAGAYTVTFRTPMSSSNYIVFFGGNRSGSSGLAGTIQSRTSSSFVLSTWSPTALSDWSDIFIGVFG